MNGATCGGLRCYVAPHSRSGQIQCGPAPAFEAPSIVACSCADGCRLSRSDARIGCGTSGCPCRPSNGSAHHCRRQSTISLTPSFGSAYSGSTVAQ